MQLRFYLFNVDIEQTAACCFTPNSARCLNLLVRLCACFLVFLVLAPMLVKTQASTASGVNVPKSAQAKPNVIFFMIDDLRPELGVYGSKFAKTPNIDRLAKNGIVFEQAFAAIPVCGASRASLLSGRKPTVQRFLTYNSRLDEDLPTAVSIPGYFKAQGYHTLANGKIFDVSADSAGAWSEPLWNPGGRWLSSVSRATRHEDLQKAYIRPFTTTLGPATEMADVDDGAYPDGEVANKSIADIQRLANSNKPYLLMVGLRKPHLPFTAPTTYWQMYQRQAFEMPTTYESAGDKYPLRAIHNSPELRRQYSGIPAEGLLPESQALELLHGYFAAVSYVDALVGEIVDAATKIVNKQNDRPTIIVLLGDHGWNLGEHTMWTKHSLFDVTLQVPLIISALSSPDDTRLKPGRSSSVVQLVDVFPTLTSLVDLPLPEALDGHTLLARGEKTYTTSTDPIAGQVADTGFAFSRWFDGESVRSADFRYSRWRNEQGELLEHMLFDLRQDPQESNNVVELQQYRHVVRELQEKLDVEYPLIPWAPLVKAMVSRRDDT